MTIPMAIPVAPEVQTQADELVAEIPLEKISFGEPAQTQPITSTLVENLVGELMRWEANFSFSDLAVRFGVTVEQVHSVYNAILKRRRLL